MGVLPGHAPMIVALRGGVISVREDGAETESLFVPGGFAEITPTRVTVLADEATPVGQLSRADAEQRIAEAEKALGALHEAEGTTPEKREAAMDRLLSARAMLAAAQAA
jgi:F-type H+-transporting ATPase subunit epsilon